MTTHKQRKSLRLKHWDYKTAGLYFVTICINNRENLFGEIKNDKMSLNDPGLMINEQWLAIFTRFQNIKPNKYVIMPNHFHAIIEVINNKPVGAPLVGASLNAKQALVNNNPEPTLGEIIGAFKSITTNKYINGVKHFNWPEFDRKLWQRNFYEHAIRNDDSLFKISEYIETNPLNWELDLLHPNNPKVSP